MLILWISVFFLAEPLIVFVFGLAAVMLGKDDNVRLNRFVFELILVCHIVAIVMLCQVLADEYGGPVSAAVMVVGLFAVKSILRPIIFGTLELLIIPFQGSSGSTYPSTAGRPWINPGSAPPPGFSENDQVL